jgi:DNA-binding MarR family transcriptional regulator
MKQEKYKNWISIIPALVLYSKYLSDKEKLVYAVISNLTHEKGYCWASNRYIAELLNCSNVTISRAVSNLHKRNYINVSLTKDEDGTNRKIYLTIAQTTNGLIKNDERANQKRATIMLDNLYKDKVINTSANELLTWINQTFNRKFTIIDSQKLNKRLIKFGMEKIKQAIKNAYNDPYHQSNNYKYLTPEYFTRNNEIIDKWLNAKSENNKRNEQNNKTREYTENISKQLGW